MPGCEVPVQDVCRTPCEPQAVKRATEVRAVM
jgi:hypothetical protein